MLESPFTTVWRYFLKIAVSNG